MPRAGTHKGMQLPSFHVVAIDVVRMQQVKELAGGDDLLHALQRCC